MGGIFNMTERAAARILGRMLDERLDEERSRTPGEAKRVDAENEALRVAICALDPYDKGRGGGPDVRVIMARR
jgi:hypothetical protein